MALTQSLEIAGEAAVKAEAAAELRPPPLDPDAAALAETFRRGLVWHVLGLLLGTLYCALAEPAVANVGRFGLSVDVAALVLRLVVHQWVDHNHARKTFLFFLIGVVIVPSFAIWIQGARQSPTPYLGASTPSSISCYILQMAILVVYPRCVSSVGLHPAAVNFWRAIVLVGVASFGCFGGDSVSDSVVRCVGGARLGAEVAIYGLGIVIDQIVLAHEARMEQLEAEKQRLAYELALSRHFGPEKRPPPPAASTAPTGGASPLYSPPPSEKSEPSGLTARMVSANGRIDQEMFREAAVRSHVNREVRAELSAFRFSNPFGPWAVQMTEGRGLPAGGTSAPGIGRVVEPPGTAYLPANLPATPSEWSSNSDDSE